MLRYPRIIAIRTSSVGSHHSVVVSYEDDVGFRVPDTGNEIQEMTCRSSTDNNQIALWATQNFVDVSCSHNDTSTQSDPYSTGVIIPMEE